MKNLVGTNLDGWRVEAWLELKVLAGEEREKSLSMGFFKDQDVALATGRDKGPWKEHGGSNVSEVFVLTKDGQTGYLIGDSTPIELSDEESLKNAVIAVAKGKLTLHERHLLGIED